MSKHLGDYDASAVIYGKFTTYRPSTGASYTLGGTPALSVYKDNSTTQSTTGVTLTADFDSVTGLNHFAIDTSADGTFYAAGSFFDIVITTGTVDSVSVTGSVVASFTIRKDSSLKPTTAARTLDVSAGGEAGVDWANVGSPTTAVNLSATNIDVDQVVASVSGAVGSVTGAVGSVTGAVGSVTGAVGSVTGNVGGNVVGSVASVVGAVGSVTGLTAANLDVAVSTRMATYAQPTGFLAATFPLTVASTTNITAGTITTVTNLTNAPTSGDLTATMKASVNTEVLDVLNTDTFAEPGQEAPPATTTLVKKIGYIYKMLRNKITQTSTTLSVFADDATTVDQKATVSDDGTTYTRGEIGSGP